MSERPKRLEGLVAAILNSRELVVNIGQHHGVRPGMKFAVLADTPLDIRDPVSGDLLDKVDREKVRVEACEVRDKITICRTYRVKRIPGGPLAVLGPWDPLGDAFRPPRKVPETLSIHDSSIPQPLSEKESYVKVKDRVVEVYDD